ncbi:MAG: LytS/YhcK type 5TM receptor domain-containing protein, partial [Candidatus Cloacimonadota bacterium]|nr:LytS/YhcK type 5TM receptor domain-containing protein [Candidatus Cloacimonadota bacterium]
MEKLFLAIWRLLVFISISLTFIYIILRIYKVADFLLVKQQKKNSKIIAAIFFSILIMATSKYPLNLVAGSAIVNVRDSIAIFASIIAGPIVGIVVGLVGGIYRISLGGWTALPCGLAVISISIIAAYLTKYKNYRIGEMTKRKILNISILIFVWEIMHTMVYCTLLGAKPFPEAFMLMARNFVIPMVVTNVIAITMFLLISRDAVIRANNMEKVKNYTKELEEKVQERTFNLDKEFQTSEQQRIATLNIFNDL